MDARNKYHIIFKNNLNADQMNGLENELRQELHNREIAFQNNH